MRVGGFKGPATPPPVGQGELESLLAGNFSAQIPELRRGHAFPEPPQCPQLPARCSL
jgi:hypothetical protein